MRRQLRFAFFLQIAGASMFAIATVIRAVGIGFDAVTGVFGLVAIVIAGAAVFTRKKMRELAA